MKAEHRKELETNLLADRMGKLVQRMKTRPQRRSLLIVVLVLVAGGAYITWNYMREDKRSLLSLRWSVLERGTNIYRGQDDITMDLLAGYRFGLRGDGKKTERRLGWAPVESDFDNPGKAARFEVARYWLWDQGVRKLANPTQPEILGDLTKDFVVGLTPLERIELAENLYLALEKECAEEPEWKAEALFGLAVITETRALQDIKLLTAAKEKYESLAKALPKTGHGKLAEKRAEDLKGRFAEVKAFYEDMKRELNIPPLKKSKVVPR